MVVGPKYITNFSQAKYCVEWINKDLIASLMSLNICMNTNVNEIRITHNQTSAPMYLRNGLMNTRALLQYISQYVPIVGSLQDQLSYMYFDDIYSLMLVGVPNLSLAGVASGMSCSIGLDVADVRELDCLTSTLDTITHPQSFISAKNNGVVGITHTAGNDDCFLVLHVTHGSVVDEILEKKEFLTMKRKIMFNLGSVSRETFDGMVEIVERIVNSGLRDGLLGFIVDSGDRYRHEALVSPDDQCSFLESLDYKPMAQDLKIERPSFKRRMLDGLKSSYYKISTIGGAQRKKRDDDIEGRVYTELLVRKIDLLLAQYATD